MKLCKDCEYRERTLFLSVSCRITPKTQDPVDGRWYYSQDPRCHYQRSFSGYCGLEGKNFSPRSPE